MSAKHLRAREPNLTRKGLLGHPRTLLLGALAVAFTAYVLGYLPQLDGLFGSAVENSRSRGLLIAGPIVLLIVGLFLLFVLVLLLGFVRNLITSVVRTFNFIGRGHTTLQQFTTHSQMQGLSVQVAKETYEILKPHYPGTMCIALEDKLRRHLILSDENILYIQSRLLNRCDRREVLSFSVETVQTVFDLMQHAEGAPPQHITGTVLRQTTVQLNTGNLTGRRTGEQWLAGKTIVQAPSESGMHNPSLDDPDFKPRNRQDYSGMLRRASDLAASSIEPSDSDPTTTKITPRRRFGETGFRPQIPAIPTDPAQSADSTGDSVFIPPRRVSDTGFRRRSTDPPAIASEPGKTQAE